MGKRELEFKTVMARSQVTSYIQDLLEGLKQGLICVQKEKEYVVLHPADLIKVEIEAGEKKDKSKFSIEMSWKNGMELKGEAQVLKISSTPPLPAMVEIPEPAGPTDPEERRSPEPSDGNWHPNDKL